MTTQIITLAIVLLAFIIIMTISLLIKWYKKPIHGKAIVVTGRGGTRITFEEGIFVIPVLHRMEIMDITLKMITISRTGKDGLICKDNLRADIQVTFFVRVNKTFEDAKNVALSIGCERASSQETLVNLFDAKFSEALKTVGKRFNFVDLYNTRDDFKHEIIQIIGRDLNGYFLDDCAIDYLEQTPLDSLKKDNILDSEGIKKIIELTSEQQILANKIERDKEKTLTKQNVEARETILELNRQLAETEAKQKKEVANINHRQEAEAKKVEEEQRLIAEQARITTQEAIEVAEQNKQRQIIVAQRNKEKTDGLEIEKLKRDVELQANERERVVAIAQIEKEKAVEEEKKNIQEVIRQRVAVEKAVVEEEEKIKDTREYAGARRNQGVTILNAETEAQESLVKQIKAAEAEKKASELQAQTKVIQADAEFATAGKKAESIKILAEADAAKEASKGKAEAQVIEAKANAKRKEAETDAFAIENKSVAEAKGIKAKAEANAIAIEKTGTIEAEINKKKGIADADIIYAKAKAEEEKGMAEARVSSEKYTVEAQGIDQKAVAMKKLDGIGKDHEEFKLKLQKEKDVELAQIHIQKDIAEAQAMVISDAVKSAKIDIVGGETMFFDQIIGSITKGKSIDRMVDNSKTLQVVKNEFFGNDDDGSQKNPGGNAQKQGSFKDRLLKFIDQFGMTSEDIKNLSLSTLIMRIAVKAGDQQTTEQLNKMMKYAVDKGIADKSVNEFL